MREHRGYHRGERGGRGLDYKGGNVWMVGNRQKHKTAPPLGYFTTRTFLSHFVCESRNVSFMEVIGGFILCSTGQPLGFCGPLMKFNLGPSFLDVCQPSTHQQRASTKHESNSVSLKPSLDIKAKKQQPRHKLWQQSSYCSKWEMLFKVIQFCTANLISNRHSLHMIK